MQLVYYTVVAIGLYFAADWILNRLEVSLGRRLEYRTLVFFVILLSLSLTTFELIRRALG